MHPQRRGNREGESRPVSFRAEMPPLQIPDRVFPMGAALTPDPQDRIFVVALRPWKLSLLLLRKFHVECTKRSCRGTSWGQRYDHIRKIFISFALAKIARGYNYIRKEHRKLYRMWFSNHKTNGFRFEIWAYYEILMLRYCNIRILYIVEFNHCGPTIVEFDRDCPTP